MRHFTLALCCTALLGAAETRHPVPVIDGSLDDAVWRSLPAGAMAPSAKGVPVETGGDIRAVVIGRYLFVAARLSEPTGRFTARVTGRNPAWEDEDRLMITAGADIGYTDRMLQVNPLGAYSVEKAVFVPYRNELTYPYADEWERQVVYQNADKFVAATSIGAKEWTVEAAIPLNELSAPASDPILVSVERVRAQRPGSPRQTWHWPTEGPAAKIPARRDDRWDAPAPVFKPTGRGNLEPVLEAGQVRELPPADSGWNDIAWRDVPAWKLTRDEPMARLPRFPTEVKLMHDGRTLAVLARCLEPGALSARVNENDGPVDQDDSFHVYLATTGSAYTRFAVNALGYLLDAHGFAGGQRVSRARDWNSETRAHIRREQGAWFARMDIPLARPAESLGERGIPLEWRVLFLRNRPGRDGEPRETSVLPVIESATALCPARYRRLLLSPSEPGRLQKPLEAAPAGALASLDSRVLSAERRKQADPSNMVERNLRGRIRKILEAEKRERDAIADRAGWERFREPRLKALAASLGEFPAHTPLHARVTKEFAGDGYRRLDLVYESRPGLWVPSNLYVPAQPRPQMPAMLIIHSHHRPRTQAELQDMGILWARAGCTVLLPDMIGHGERLETYPWNREGYHSRYLTGMQLYVAGESLMKWMVWDIMRGVDLLLERKDVNPAQIILLGAVAAGGDPAAVVAALDKRIAAVVPFNFGEATPGAMRSGSGSSGLSRPGWGEWESTRNLAGSISGQFFPWFICASVAPRKFVYSYEMGWKVEEATAWARYQKVFGLYGALDNLDEAHGFGEFPGPGECANIGPSQRKTLYPELKRWFGIPAPAKEPDDRRPEAELAALNPAVASELQMQPVHQLARSIAEAKLTAARTELKQLTPGERVEWLRKRLAAKLGDVQPGPNFKAVSHWRRHRPGLEAEGIELEVEPGITVPILLLRPAGAGTSKTPVAVIVSQDGKDKIVAQDRREVEALLAAGVTVCLPDVRGTGETEPDQRRGPSSEGTSLAATELMLGNTLLGARLKDLRTVMAWLDTRQDLDARNVALWGESFAPANAERLLPDEAPNWQIGPQIQHQAEPLGGMLAVLGALFDDRIRAVAVRGGLASYLSILEDPFVYVPKDIIVPGIVEAGDLGDVVAALTPRTVLLVNMVDGRNRLVTGPKAETDIGAWLSTRLATR